MSCLGLTGVELQLCRAADAAEQAAAAASALRAQRDAAGAFATVADAVAALAVPVVLLLLLWHLWPVLREILEKRKFTIKIAGFELSAQEATDQLRTQIEDLQGKVAALSAAAAGEIDPDRGPDEVAGDRRPPERRRRGAAILWVDDVPANNAVLIAGFRDSGIEVVTAASTSEAMSLLGDGPGRFSAVISDQGRIENGTYVKDAGNGLVRQMRGAGFDVPVAIFASARGVQAARDVDVELTTISGTELRRFVEHYAGVTRAD